MSDSSRPPSGIVGTVAAAVIAAGIIWAVGTGYRVLNPPVAIRASVNIARVSVPPQGFIEPMQLAGCDDTVPFGDTLEVRVSHERRVADCAAIIGRYFAPLEERAFTLTRVEIENTGRAPEENVRVSAPGFDYAVAFVTGREVARFVEDQSISLGSLAPGESAAVQIWSIYSANTSDIEVFSNSGKTPMRAYQGESYRSDDIFEDILLTALRTGMAPLFVVVFVIGILILLALFASLLGHMSEKPKAKVDG